MNSILTSLDFLLSNFSFFCLWDFLVVLLSRTHHQAFSVKFCRISWVPEHEVETKWPQFSLAWIPSKTQRRKVADCEKRARVAHTCSNKFPKWFFCYNLISNFIFHFFSLLIADSRNFIKIFFQAFALNLKGKRILLVLRVSVNSVIYSEKLRMRFWKMWTEKWAQKIQSFWTLAAQKIKKIFELDFEEVLQIFRLLKLGSNKKILSETII